MYISVASIPQEDRSRQGVRAPFLVLLLPSSLSLKHGSLGQRGFEGRIIEEKVCSHRTLSAPTGESRTQQLLATIDAELAVAI